MYVEPDAAMSGSCCVLVKVLCFVTRSFICIVSKDRGMCGRGLFVPLVWMGVGCVRLSVCNDVDVLEMVAHRGSYDGLFMISCAVGVVCICWCLCRMW